MVNDEIVGFLFAERKQYPPCFVKRDHGLISDLAVTADRRRRGIGAALLAEGMAWFASQGLETVEARVLMANPISTSFWQKMGFSPYLQTVRRIEHVGMRPQDEPDGTGPMPRPARR